MSKDASSKERGALGLLGERWRLADTSLPRERVTLSSSRKRHYMGFKVARSQTMRKVREPQCQILARPTDLVSLRSNFFFCLVLGFLANGPFLCFCFHFIRLETTVLFMRSGSVSE